MNAAIVQPTNFTIPPAYKSRPHGPPTSQIKGVVKGDVFQLDRNFFV